MYTSAVSPGVDLNGPNDFQNVGNSQHFGKKACENTSELSETLKPGVPNFFAVVFIQNFGNAPGLTFEGIV